MNGTHSLEKPLQRIIEGESMTLPITTLISCSVLDWRLNRISHLDVDIEGGFCHYCEHRRPCFGKVGRLFTVPAYRR